MQTMANQIIEAHNNYCDHTAERMLKLTAVPFELKINEDLTTNRLNAWSIYAQEMEKEIKSIAGFVQRIPEMQNLPVQDTAILLRMNMFPIHFLRVVRELSSEGFMFGDGRYINYSSLELLYGGLTDKMMRLSNYIDSLNCSDEDLVFLSLLVLCQPFTAEYTISSDFGSHLPLSQLHVKYQKLSQHKMANYPDVFHKLVALIPVLNKLNGMHHKELDIVREYRSHLNLPPNFIETFRINEPTELCQEVN